MRCPLFTWALISESWPYNSLGVLCSLWPPYLNELSLSILQGFLSHFVPWLHLQVLCWWVGCLKPLETEFIYSTQWCYFRQDLETTPPHHPSQLTLPASNLAITIHQCMPNTQWLIPGVIVWLSIDTEAGSERCGNCKMSGWKTMTGCRAWQTF